MKVFLKRAYAPPAAADGVRVLVDRLWPRGIRRQALRLHAWLKPLAPSNDLRQWYHAHREQWRAFRRRYLAELAEPEAEAALEQLHEMANGRKPLTLVYSSRDEERNNAVVLKELLDGLRKPPVSTGPVRAAAAGRKAARGRR